MRLLTTLLTAAVLIACSTTPAPREPLRPPSASDESVVEYLLTSAAADFRAHGPPPPLVVRSVRSGYNTTPEGAVQHMLCGEVSSARSSSGAEWTPFVTIRTVAYEQLLGPQAHGHCTSASMTWNEGDLSSLLQSRLDARR